MEFEHKKTNPLIIVITVIVIAAVVYFLIKAFTSNKEDNTNQTYNYENSTVEVSEFGNHKVEELKENGYWEIDPNKFAYKLRRSGDSKYKYEINAVDIDGNTNTLYIDDANKMYINGNVTSYKYKMVIGNEQLTYIVTEDDYLFDPSDLSLKNLSKIKNVLENNNTVTVVFDDGYTIDIPLN